MAYRAPVETPPAISMRVPRRRRETDGGVTGPCCRCSPSRGSNSGPRAGRSSSWSWCAAA
eukprot:7318643-Alexandrium_andersonii.AAC.1